MAKLSAAIITMNEAANLPRWIEGVRPWADEIVAVDSGSTDDTVRLLGEAGALVRHRAWSGYADQRNYCQSLCGGDWIIMLDADEVPDKELCSSLIGLRSGADPEVDAFEVLFRVHFFGRFLRHGGFYPEKKLRVYRPSAASWTARQVHEHLQVPESVGILAGHVDHYSYQTLGQYLRRADRYSAEAARQMYASGRKAGMATVIGHAFWSFFNRYLLRLGFLDGFEGYMAARMEATYTFLKYARLWEMHHESKGG